MYLTFSDSVDTSLRECSIFHKTWVKTDSLLWQISWSMVIQSGALCSGTGWELHMWRP